MKNILIILSSTRPGRAGDKVAEWVFEKSKSLESELNFEFIDLKELALPFLDEPFPPMMGEEPVHEHTKNWSKIVDNADGFIIVTPEYNHGYPASLKNALDFLYKEWANKPVGLVGYGGSGARDSTRQLREVLMFMKLKPLHTQIGIGEIWDAFDEDKKLKEKNVHGDINELFKEFTHFFK